MSARLADTGSAFESLDDGCDVLLSETLRAGGLKDFANGGESGERSALLGGFGEHEGLIFDQQIDREMRVEIAVANFLEIGRAVPA